MRFWNWNGAFSVLLGTLHPSPFPLPPSPLLLPRKLCHHTELHSWYLNFAEQSSVSSHTSNNGTVLYLTSFCYKILLWRLNLVGQCLFIRLKNCSKVFFPFHTRMGIQNTHKENKNKQTNKQTKLWRQFKFTLLPFLSFYKQHGCGFPVLLLQQGMFSLGSELYTYLCMSQISWD